MSVQLQSESPLTLADAARLIPGHPSIATMWRWVQSGCRGNLLESFLVGGRRYTTREAVDRFIARSNGKTMPATSGGDQHIAVAEAYCRAKGI